MRKTVFFGLALVALNFTVPFTLASGEILNIDVFPDFLGFVLIFLGLENMPYNNRFLREISNFAVVFAVISFITFACHLSPIYISPIGFSEEGFAFVGAIIAGIKDLYIKFEYIILAVYMIYVAFASLAIRSEIVIRIKTAPILKSFSTKNQYSETVYSKKAYKIFTVLSAVFCVLYFVITAAYLVNYFNEIKIDILGLSSAVWVVFLPVHALFIYYLNTAVDMIAEKRQEYAG